MNSRKSADATPTISTQEAQQVERANKS
ncbi:MAG: hypothetical protein QOE57_1316, partial [Acidimicrobiaceae bacterium]|nr:hypothetical protein [Acidimicrobiaceae bacterium]